MRCFRFATALDSIITSLGRHFEIGSQVPPNRVKALRENAEMRAAFGAPGRRVTPSELINLNNQYNYIYNYITSLILTLVDLFI